MLEPWVQVRKLPASQQVKHLHVMLYLFGQICTTGADDELPPGRGVR